MSIIGTVAKRAYAEIEEAEERRRAYAEYKAQKKWETAEQDAAKRLKRQKEHEKFVAWVRAPGLFFRVCELATPSTLPHKLSSAQGGV